MMKLLKNGKKLEIIVISLVIAMIFIVVSTHNNYVAKNDKINSAIETIQKVFDDGNKTLLTGKEPNLSVFVSERAAFDIVKIFRIREYPFAKATGDVSIKDTSIEPDDVVKVHLFYNSHKVRSETELKNSIGVNKEQNDLYEYDFYLKEIDGNYKIINVKLYTDADIPSS